MAVEGFPQAIRTQNNQEAMKLMEEGRGQVGRSNGKEVISGIPPGLSPIAHPADQNEPIRQADTLNRGTVFWQEKETPRQTGIGKSCAACSAPCVAGPEIQNVEVGDRRHADSASMTGGARSMDGHLRRPERGCQPGSERMPTEPQLGKMRGPNGIR